MFPTKSPVIRGTQASVSEVFNYNVHQELERLYQRGYPQRATDLVSLIRTCNPLDLLVTKFDAIEDMELRCIMWRIQAKTLETYRKHGLHPITF